THAEELGEGLGQADAEPGAGFIVNIAQEGEVPMIKVHLQRQALIEKPWFDEGQQVVLPLGANLGSEPQFLPAARKEWRVRDIKIALAQFDEADEVVDGAETGTHGEVAGVLFLDPDHEVAAVGNAGFLGLRLYLVEVLELIKT